MSVASARLAPLWELSQKHKTTEITIYVATERDFAAHNSFDLVDWSKVPSFAVPAQAPVEWIKRRIAAVYGITPERQRLWIWVARSNGSYRPERPLTKHEEELSISELRYYAFYLEVIRLNVPLPLPPLLTTSRLIFFKTFNCRTKTLSYLGHAYVTETLKVSDLDPIVARLVPSRTGARPLYFEEVRPSMINALSPWATLLKEEISTGDIIIVHPSYSMQDTSAVTVMFSMVSAESRGLPAEFPSPILMRPSDDDLLNFTTIPDCMLYLVYDEHPHTSWGLRLFDTSRSRPPAPVLAPLGRTDFPALKMDDIDFTICLWFAVPTAPLGVGWILSAWSPDDGERKFRFCFQPHSTNASICSLSATLYFQQASLFLTCTAGELMTHTWYHVAMTWLRSRRRLTLFVNAEEVGSATLSDESSLLLRSTSQKWQLGRSSAQEGQECHMTDICVLARAADADALRRIAISNRPSTLARLFCVTPADCLAITYEELRKVAVRNKGKERLIEEGFVAGLNSPNSKKNLSPDGEGTDVRITFIGRDEGSLQAHREVLCGRSDYFRNLLEGPMSKGVSKDKEGKVNVSVKLPSLPFALFTRIVSSIYSGEIVLDLEEVECVLDALDYFSLSKLAVAQVLKRKFTPENVLSSLRLATEYNAPEIRLVALEYVLAHLDRMEVPFAAAPKEERKDIAIELIVDLPTIRDFLA